MANTEKKQSDQQSAEDMLCDKQWAGKRSKCYSCKVLKPLLGSNAADLLEHLWWARINPGFLQDEAWRRGRDDPTFYRTNAEVAAWIGMPVDTLKHKNGPRARLINLGVLYIRPELKTLEWWLNLTTLSQLLYTAYAFYTRKNAERWQKWRDQHPGLAEGFVYPHHTAKGQVNLVSMFPNFDRRIPLHLSKSDQEFFAELKRCVAGADWFKKMQNRGSRSHLASNSFDCSRQGCFPQGNGKPRMGETHTGKGDKLTPMRGETHTGKGVNSHGYMDKLTPHECSNDKQKQGVELESSLPRIKENKENKKITEVATSLRADDFLDSIPSSLWNVLRYSRSYKEREAVLKEIIKKMLAIKTGRTKTPASWESTFTRIIYSIFEVWNSCEKTRFEDFYSEVYKDCPTLEYFVRLWCCHVLDRGGELQNPRPLLLEPGKPIWEDFEKRYRNPEGQSDSDDDDEDDDDLDNEDLIWEDFEKRCHNPDEN